MFDYFVKEEYQLSLFFVKNLKYKYRGVLHYEKNENRFIYSFL